jgi:hypothetical protein
MNIPTPRTDAAWAKTFLDDDDQCRAGNAATDMRAECATLERELAAERARLDWLGDNVEEIYRERDQRGSCVYLSGENIRDAIDAAMKEGAK